MKKMVLVLIFLLTVLFLGNLMTEAAGKFTLTSKSFKDGGFLSMEQVYNGLGCAGKNISPDLSWKNAPKGTKSFVLIMHDPDAPVEGGWYHWVVANIPSVKSGFDKGEMVVEPIILTATNFDEPGYGGPCPPVGHGKHRYVFTLYALSVSKINAKPGFLPQYIEAVIKPNILGIATLTGYFERK